MRTAMIAATLGSVGLFAATVSADTVYTFTQIDVPGATVTNAFGINNAGQIVGTFLNSTGAHGFLDTGGRFTQIDVPGATATNAYGINDNGEIVGVVGGVDVTGSHGFIAAPVPEPSTLALVGVAVIGLRILRRQQGTRERRSVKLLL